MLWHFHAALLSALPAVELIDSELVIVGPPLGFSVTDTAEGVASNLRAGTAPLLTSFFLCHHVLVGNYVRACHQKVC